MVFIYQFLVDIPAQKFGLETWWGIVVSSVYLLGALNAAHAIMKVRLAQSAIAWSVFLLTMPWIAMPIYWVFGRRKFEGYTKLMRRAQTKYESDRSHLCELMTPFVPLQQEPIKTLNAAAVKLNAFPFTFGNETRLLINASQTYMKMFEAIEKATDYILFQTYILNDDQTGRRFLDALSQASRRGVRVFVLYDEIGSTDLTRRYLRDAKKNGVICSGFKTTKGPGNRFQINFRNHRKIIVLDGRTGFVGGHNIGDEQLGLNPKIGSWRDTHLMICGPAVKALQFSFLSDWFWAMEFVPETSWDMETAPQANEEVLVHATGPNDDSENCSLFLGSLTDIARKRIWIATPYFVPDEPILSALKIAAIRGVDVRIILPRNNDHLIMKLCALSYFEDVGNSGIKIYEYLPGFMHQKVFLVDDLIAGIGTVNLDNRSINLNFEVMAYVTSSQTISQISEMLENDLAQSELADLTQYHRHKLPYRVAVKLTRLFSSIL